MERGGPDPTRTMLCKELPSLWLYQLHVITLEWPMHSKNYVVEQLGGSVPRRSLPGFGYAAWGSRCRFCSRTEKMGGPEQYLESRMGCAFKINVATGMEWMNWTAPCLCGTQLLEGGWGRGFGMGAADAVFALERRTCKHGTLTRAVPHRNGLCTQRQCSEYEKNERGHLHTSRHAVQ